MKKILLSLISLMFLLSSCSNDVVSEGKVTFNFSTSRRIDPQLDMNVTSYSLVVSDSTGNVKINEANVNETSSYGPLLFGTYKAVVEGLNAAGETVLSMDAPAEFEISTGETTVVDINLIPTQGSGNVDITVQVSTTQVQNPSVEATITPFGGNAQPLVFTSNAQKSELTTNTSGLSSGYQTLILNLKDNNASVRGVVELVRIASDSTSSAVYNWKSKADGGDGLVNEIGGRLNVNIKVDNRDAIIVENRTPVANVSPGDVITLSSIVPSDPDFGPRDNFNFIWYGGVSGIEVIDGVKTGTVGEDLTASYTVPTTIPDTIDNEYHMSFTVIVYTEDGTRAGDTNFVITAVK